MTTAADLVVAIVGTGIGGTELAGYLGLNRQRVRVHDVRPEAVSGIHSANGTITNWWTSGESDPGLLGANQVSYHLTRGPWSAASDSNRPY